MAKEEPIRASSPPAESSGYTVISKPNAAIRVEERQRSPEERKAFDIGNLPLGRKSPSPK